jgi:hypothetical protein
VIQKRSGTRDRFVLQCVEHWIRFRQRNHLAARFDRNLRGNQQEILFLTADGKHGARRVYDDVIGSGPFDTRDQLGQPVHAAHAQNN